MSGLVAREVTNPNDWNTFVEGSEGHAFPQLWEWGEVRRARGWEPIRVGLFAPASRQPTAGAQILLRRVPVTGWYVAHAPRGPVGALEHPETLEALTEALRRLTGSRTSSLLVDPAIGYGHAASRMLSSASWKPAVPIEPMCTRVIDLTASPDELERHLRRRYRRYLRSVDDQDIVVDFLDARSGQEALSTGFSTLLEVTHSLNHRGIELEDASYYRRAWESLSAGGHAELCVASIGTKAAASVLHIMCGRHVAAYVGGQRASAASTHALLHLHWRSMLRYRARGFHRYDFWGLPTAGIRHFKAGFGGREERYVGTRRYTFRTDADLLNRVFLRLLRTVERTRPVSSSDA